MTECSLRVNRTCGFPWCIFKFIGKPDWWRYVLIRDISGFETRYVIERDIAILYFIYLGRKDCQPDDLSYIQKNIMNCKLQKWSWRPRVFPLKLSLQHDLINGMKAVFHLKGGTCTLALAFSCCRWGPWDPQGNQPERAYWSTWEKTNEDAQLRGSQGPDMWVTLS